MDTALGEPCHGDIIVIPAYNPDARLIKLVNEIHERVSDAVIVVVNDGSGSDKDPIFEELEQMPGCTVLRHAENSGKGAALKTAARYIGSTYPNSGFTMADADYQHLPDDIVKVAASSKDEPDCLILGRRDFNKGGAPLRNKLGNRITSIVFRLATRVSCADTQTGLRGVPASLVPQINNISGERFDFEMNMLFAAARQHVQLREIPIDTVYEKGNKTTHFHPVIDSLKIYKNIAKFCASSLACAGVDIGLFTLLYYTIFTGEVNGVFISTMIARVVSGALNFTLNKNAVFKERGRTVSQGIKYGLLFCVIMMSSGLFSTLLSHLMYPTLAKIITDCCLFLISYAVQSKLVFRKGAEFGE